MTWHCTQREKKYAEKDARGAAAHVATHARTKQKYENKNSESSKKCLPEFRRNETTPPSCNTDKKSEER